MIAKRKRERAREYLRVSADASGRMESPEQQHETNARHAAQNGWTLGEPYAETCAVSASRYSTKARAAFDRLTADLAAGRFGADVLILWESSRGSRRVGEWVGLVEKCEAAGVAVYVTTHGRAYDPANARDRRALLEDAVDSEYESAKISARTSRAAAAAASAGKPHGRAPYGYRRVYDPVTRRLVAQEPDPAEAAVVRELFARLAKGESFKGIARDWRERGLLTRGSGKFPPRPFSPEHLRSMALNVAYGGKRVHQPVTGPRRHGSLDGAVDGTWPALVPAATFYAVQALLKDPARRSSRPGKGVHELSMIALCGDCGGALSVTYRRGPRNYACRDKSCVSIPADALDAYAADVMCAYLDRDDNAAQLAIAPEDAPELDAVRGELEAARAELADWQQRARRREVSAASFAAIEPGLLDAIRDLGQRERQLSAPPALAGFLDGAASARARWNAADTATRRRVAKLLCAPQYLGYLKVGKSPVPGHSVPVEQRVTWDRS